MFTASHVQLSRAIGRALALGAGLAFVGLAVAAPAADERAEIEALKQENGALKHLIEELARREAATEAKIEQLSRSTGSPKDVATTANGGPAPAPAPAPAATAEPRLEKFLAGFYGTLDVSLDNTTKGINGLVAYSYSLIDPANPNSGYVAGANPKAGPVGRLGWMPSISTNKSVIGYRGAHKIGKSDTEFVYQIETQPAITAAPGLATSSTAQSNVTKAGIGYGDSFVGLANKDWGKLKVGTTYAPYKKSTDRLNPFSGMLGDYAVIMGNTGGDNRVEFGTRLEHAIWYESPKFANLVNVDILFSPGQNRTQNDVIQSAGSPDCNGGNIPGSGNLLLNCDDGGFDNAFSADIKIETGSFYATAAYEIHKNVNRNSDGIGSNHPYYGYLLSTNSGLLDFATYTALPAWMQAASSPAYLTDIGDEAAYKIGAQYKFSFGLTASAIWERMTRDLPAALVFQNERQRNGSWLALTQDVTSAGSLSIGWAHAGKTPGDPGGQHNYNPLAPANTADMYTIAWRQRLDKSLTWYIDAADTINHGNAHYDLGAGGRGVTTDCHDGTNTVYIDNSSSGPTTWGGCHVMGVSTGLNYRF